MTNKKTEVKAKNMGSKINYNREFEDLVNTINDIARGYGFKNGIDWASLALRSGEISYEQYKNFENVHNLRIRFSHGNARDISVSQRTFSISRNFEYCIRHSTLRNRKKTPVLPSGTFRAAPYIKEFNHEGKDGEEYYFKFEVYKENNYFDDGYVGARGFGYFIHIKSAPYFSIAKNYLHDFHMIHTSNDGYHICWDKLIDNFESANAVMFVWVKRYSELIDRLKQKNSTNELALMQKANKKHILPVGTFRFPGGNRISQKRKNNGRKNNTRKTIYIQKEIYDKVMSILGTQKPELGGIFGFSEDQTIINAYYFDSEAKTTFVEYSPNTKILNKIIEEWEDKGVYLAGFVHSHPGNFNQLSYADIEYSVRIIKEFELEYLFTPIVTSSYGFNKMSFNGYIVTKGGTVERVNVELIKPNAKEIENSKTQTVFGKTDKDGCEISEVLLKMVEAEFDELDRKNKIRSNNLSELITNQKPDTIYSRIEKIIDIEYMKSCSIIGIGCGGSRSFYESMARIGVGNFYLMDGDTSSFSNIASQNGYISEIGIKKPDTVKKRINDINTDINVQCFNCMLNDDITDEYLEKNILENIDTTRTVLCAFTDDFYAQARASRIAIKYKIPFISAQNYEFGKVSELIFWYPNVTKYSQREILKSRYESYRNGYSNTVTSDCSPIFNTTRLNALCEKIAIGMLLYGHNQSHIYSRFLRVMPNKNLILIKQGILPDYDELQLRFFCNHEDSCFDDVVWLSPEEVEDLSSVAKECNSKIDDTRNIFEKIKDKDFMIQFGIKSIDEIISQDKNVYILNKGYNGTGVASFEINFCKYKLLKNLLESGNSCGVLELGGGDAFKNLYGHQEGFKREYSNPNLDTKEYFEFDEKAMKTVMNYPLYELKVFGNEHNEILDYIKNFLLGKVKYLFITGLNKDIKIINSLLEIAKTTNTVFILQISLREIPENLKDMVMDFNLNKETKEFTVSMVDDNGKLIYSKPMKHYEDGGIGYIGETNMDKNLIEKVKEYIKDKSTISATQLQLEFEIGYPEAREIVDILIKEDLVKTNVDGKICVVSSKN